MPTAARRLARLIVPAVAVFVLILLLSDPTNAVELQRANDHAVDPDLGPAHHPNLIFQVGDFDADDILGIADIALDSHDRELDGTPMTKPRRVAIIGAGAAGSSAAYFLSKAYENNTANAPEITVYEASDRVGGRAKMFDVPVSKEDDPMGREGTVVSVETGASIFSLSNRNLVEFAKANNLSFNEDKTPPVPPLGIFNGKEFVYQASTSPNYDLAEKDELAFETVEGFLTHLELIELAEAPSREKLTELGMGELYLNELVEFSSGYQAATRVNYAQNLDLNSLATCICLIAAFIPVHNIAGGNERIYEQMMVNSGAKVLLETEVTRILKRIEGGKVSYAVGDAYGNMDEYDAVIVAVPATKALSAISFEGIPKPVPVPFVHLHVTFVTGVLNKSYFGVATTADLPRTIATTNNPSCPFNSIGVRSFLANGVTVSKIFSPQPLSDDVLGQIYSEIRRVDRFEWDSYPVLTPVKRGQWPRFELEEGTTNGGGVYYVNALEAAFSAMESETVAARNVVQLLKRRWEGKGSTVVVKKGGLKAKL
ncbi:hypothetical protein HK101_000563 [Irineochytrium annulatum]|nr:hypothetical protein HK101_000563 [Irineochytrium annulatum]